MIRILRLLWAIGLVLLASSLASAQNCTTYSLEGTLIIPVRDYPENFEVLLLSHMGEQVYGRTNVNIEKRFSFFNLQADRYDVVIRLEGFQELRQQVFVPSFGSMTCIAHEIIWLTPVDAVVVVDERLRGYPKEAIDEYVLAVNADSDRHYDEVVKHLEKVVKLAPDWFDAHCELGAAYEEVHRNNDAEKEYRAALDLKPDGFRALLSLGRLFVAVADNKLQVPAEHDAVQPILNQAHEVLSAAILHDPMSAMASYLLGAVDFRQASYSNAEIELKRALELDSTIFPARITLLNVYVQQKRWQDALDQADTFILENSNSPYRQQVLATRSSIVRRLQVPQ